MKERPSKARQSRASAPSHPCQMPLILCNLRAWLRRSSRRHLAV